MTWLEMRHRRKLDSCVALLKGMGSIMQKLTHANFIKARNFVFKHSDDINQAWFRYNFENENTAEFMEALAKYQREDGGFGGLVYEFDYQGSCLVSTEMAFRYIFFLKEKPAASHPVIQNAIKYLLSRYRPDIGCWGEECEPEVNDGVHVGWMGYTPNSYPPIADVDERIKKYRPNRQATFAAFIALYSEIVPEEIYNDIIFYPIEKILHYYDQNSPLFRKSTTDDHFESDIDVPYNLCCYQLFVQCLKDKTQAEKLAKILRQNPTACMELNKNNWVNEYEDLPCFVVKAPDSCVYPAVKDLVDESLDYLIRQQSEGGAWHLYYSWGENEAFRKMEKSYEAHMTMLFLAKLKRFGRIEYS